MDPLNLFAPENQTSNLLEQLKNDLYFSHKFDYLQKSLSNLFKKEDQMESNPQQKSMSFDNLLELL